MNKIIKDFNNYNIENYKKDVKSFGMEKVWNEILENVLDCDSNKIFTVQNFGELYEIGLAENNKISKKELGKYYTPEDVATVMSTYFSALSGNNICDVCCGTGNLILSFLNVIDIKNVKKILEEKRLFLYDIDSLALKICKFSIAIKFGKEYFDNINIIEGDFLDTSIRLPENSKVISNPPYFKITNIKDSWEKDEIIEKSKEFYCAIMGKILKQSISSVIITPYSFISGDKFYPLRKEMNNHTGFIISFDNVPGNIFNGKKHGIFNTNNANSVRAAITVTKNNKPSGYKISPLIRFKTDEREKLLNSNILIDTIPSVYQTVTEDKKRFFKCDKTLIELYTFWNNKSNKKLKDYFSKNEENSLCFPNSCRYFTVSSVKKLDRTGKYTLNFKTKEDMYLSYCFLNSSFAYWHWRLFDGGVNFALGLLSDMPVFFDNLSSKEKENLIKIAKEMIEKENDYLVYKLNAGKAQENIKFPESYRKKINKILVKNLTEKEFNIEKIHNNFFFEKGENIGKE